MSYLNFSICYDEVLGHKFFNLLKDKFKEVSKKYNIENYEEILDLGCGTGLFLKNFYGSSIKLFGIDMSFPMLFYGKKSKDFKAVCFKFPPIPMKGKFSLIVSFYDTLNHILDPKSLKEIFLEVRRLLKRNGFFLFDTNNLVAFKKIMADKEPFIFESEEGFVKIYTKYLENLKLSKAEIFGVWKGVKINEEIYERYWNEMEIKDYLKEAGFKFIKKEGWIMKRFLRNKAVKDFWIVKI